MPTTASDRPGPHTSRPSTVREIETKFDVSPDYAVPDLNQLAGKHGKQDVDQVNVSSTYYDTPYMQLLSYRLTLRHREGQADTGWQLKVPGAGFRTEQHWAGEIDHLPAGLLRLLRPFLGDAVPIPALRLDVLRSRHRLLDADGQLRLEVAHDDVRATQLGVAVKAARWQEVEAELGPAGDSKLLARTEAVLRDAGAFTSTSRSKVARAVVGIGNESLGLPKSAGAVLLDYISAQADALVAGYFAIHDDLEDSVHQTRVACRRLRSLLRTFEPYFEGEAAGLLEQELRWYAEILGEVRDREVLRVRLAAAIAELPSELIIGPVAQRIDAGLGEELVTARVAVLATQDGIRYAQLLASVARWRSDPPFTALAERGPESLRKPLHRVEAKLAKRLEAATGGHGTDADMHGARKAGKRARYAAEAVESENSVFVKQGKALQDLLGEFQDSVVAAEALQRLAAQARDRGEDGFTYGVLLADQRARARDAKSRARAF